MKETYKHMKDRHEAEYNAFPIGAAFSDDQLVDMKRKLGVTDNKEILSLGGGCFIRRTDKEAYLELCRRTSKEMDEAMRDEDFAVSAFEYEAANHEFHFNLDPHFDMAECFGYPTKRDGDYTKIDWDKVPNGKFLKRCYDIGVRRFLKHAQY